MENWCWSQTLAIYLPATMRPVNHLLKELLDKMLAAKNYGRQCLFCASWSSAVRLPPTEFSPEQGAKILETRRD